MDIRTKFNVRQEVWYCTRPVSSFPRWETWTYHKARVDSFTIYVTSGTKNTYLKTEYILVCLETGDLIKDDERHIFETMEEAQAECDKRNVEDDN